MIPVDELERIGKEVTAGEWFRWTTSGDVSSKLRDCAILFVTDTRKDDSDTQATVCTEEGDANCDFIVAARNNWDEMIVRLQERDELLVILQLFVLEPVAHGGLPCFCKYSEGDHLPHIHSMRCHAARAAIAKSQLSEEQRSELRPSKTLSPKPTKPHKILGQSLSDEELERAFDNVDVDVRCGACMEIFFTGSSPHTHSCAVGQSEFTHPWKGK